MNFLVFFTSILLTFSLSDPDPSVELSQLNGIWKGVLTQERGGYTPEYHFELKLTQKNKTVRGISFVSAHNIYAYWKLEGIFEEGVFTFRETALGKHTQLEDLYWCIKRATLQLRLEGNTWILEGDWSGVSEMGPCVPGKIHLEKKIPQV